MTIREMMSRINNDEAIGISLHNKTYYIEFDNDYGIITVKKSTLDTLGYKLTLEIDIEKLGPGFPSGQTISVPGRHRWRMTNER